MYAQLHCSTCEQQKTDKVIESIVHAYIQLFPNFGKENKKLEKLQTSQKR